ncbi:MAG: hypothetical protein ACLSFJ_00795 [Holdemania filiformis]
MLSLTEGAKHMDYQVNDPELQRKLDLADNVIQPKTRQESRLQRYCWVEDADKNLN